MSKFTFMTPYEARGALCVRCPRCLVGVGITCKTASINPGTPMSEPHIQRVRLAKSLYKDLDLEPNTE